MKLDFDEFLQWVEDSPIYVFSGCVEENYPAIKEGLLKIGKLLDIKMYTYPDQSCCTGPLTKMGFGNKDTLAAHLSANFALRNHNERIMLTSCNGCYSYMVRSEVPFTDLSLIGKADKEGKMLLLHSAEFIAAFFDRLYLSAKYIIGEKKFVPQYGCHYMNQYRLGMEYSFRNLYARHKNIKGWTYNSVPTYLEDIAVPFGAKIVDYAESLLCCGGATPQRQLHPDNAEAVAFTKFSALHTANPDAILTICPLCMYWMEAVQFTEKFEQNFDRKIPILHINELMAVLLGFDELVDKIVDSHKISPADLLEEITRTG